MGLNTLTKMLKSITFLLCAVASLAIQLPPRPAVHVNFSSPGSGKIINGRDAKEGEFPYIVSLNYAEGEGHSCGASILTPSWVLTAAHCCLTGAEEYVYSSSIYLSKGGLNFGILERHVHPEYDPNNYWHNDICLIKILGAITMGPNAKEVKLPKYNFTVPDNSPVVIPGWGYTTASTPQKVPDRLQVVTKYSTRSNCESLTEVPSFEGHLCAVGGGGQGVCQGDSGGPLTYGDVQVGITSFVFLPCASTGFPDYFTRVSNYIPWIQLTLAIDANLLHFSD